MSGGSTAQDRTRILPCHSAPGPESRSWPLYITNMGLALISIELCWFGRVGCAWLRLGHSSLGKVRPAGCIAAKSEMRSAAIPAEKYFQGKYLKHEQQGSGVEIAGKVKSVGFVHMLALKSGGPPLSSLAPPARPMRTSPDGFITEAFSLSPLGASPSPSSWWEHGKEHRVPSPGKDENTGGSACLWDRKSHGA